MPRIFTSKKSPKSKILDKTFNSRLEAIFGWTAVGKNKAQTEFEKNTGLRLVNVDTSNEAYRIKQAALGSVFTNKPLSENLNKYLNAYLNETTIVYSDIRERAERINKLKYACLNDPYLGAVCELVANEATMISDQNRLISIESSSPAFISRCYQLFAQWGITDQRVYNVCKNLEMTGEAIWVHKVSPKGIEKVIPKAPITLKERLEFNPAKVAENIAELNQDNLDGGDRKTKFMNYIDTLTKDRKSINELNENYAEMMETKLLGFEFEDGIILPPWCVTHFRFQGDSEDFFPYGNPPLLKALAPFNKVATSMALQGLARASSFPTQVFTVKNTEGLGPGSAFENVDTVRQEYENIGVTPSTNSLEVYTLNTKIWVPEGLLDMKVIKSEVDFNFIDDIELYQDQVAIAAGVPKAYLDQEFGGFGNSGIALKEQYRPFANHVYAIQSAFIEGLGQLLRLHFAITGEFDYNTPFVISMRFPAEEMGQEKRDSRNASLEMSKNIIDLIKDAIALEDDESLPEEIVTDILSKYTFLDPTDILRWVSISKIEKSNKSDGGDGNDDDDNGGGDMSMDIDFGGGGGGGGPDEGGDDFDLDAGTEDTGDMGVDAGSDAGGDTGGEAAPANENSNLQRDYYLKTKKLLKEQIKRQKEARLKEVTKRYNESRESIYMQFLQENNFDEWQNRREGSHDVLSKGIQQWSSMYDTFEFLNETRQSSQNRLKEDISLEEAMNASKLK